MRRFLLAAVRRWVRWICGPDAESFLLDDEWRSPLFVPELGGELEA
ncbi:MAG: hypothetical protein JSR83_22950 [Proteobacteria bacterium]|nr:hypothetical protein [Pseudomonadota bacterium]